MPNLYEKPSTYVPNGAVFNGACAAGVVAMIEAADASGANWSELCVGMTYAQIENALYWRTVDGDIVYGVAL